MRKNYKTSNVEQLASGGVLSPQGFRLISLYIGSFGLFKGQVMNFCSDYRTEVKNSKGRLRLEVKHKNVLPDNFFALNEGNEGNGCVKSVSAIVGGNASGKTTIARLLCNLPASDERKSGWKTVLIYEDAGGVKFYSTFSPVAVELISDTGERQTIAPDDYFPRYKLFYYSPHFTTEQFLISTTGYHVDYGTRDEGEWVKNISTTWLLLHPEGNSELLSHVGARQSSIYDADEKLRLFEFIAEYKKKCVEIGNVGEGLEEKFDVPLPEAISIGVHVEGFQLAQHEILGNADRLRIVKNLVEEERDVKLSAKFLKDPVHDYLRDVGQKLTSYWNDAGGHSLVANVFMSFVARYIQESGIFNTSFPTEELDKGFLRKIKSFLDDKGWSDRHKIQKCLEDHPLDLMQEEETLREKKMKELIEVLETLCSKQNSFSPEVTFEGNTVTCNLGNPEILEMVCRLVRLHAETRLISSYLKFDVVPHMSSGEMCVLTLFARLYHFIRRNGNLDNIVVFFDEAETTLHPEWQRRLVTYCIRFFEVFVPNRNFQLIFSSHSPMLLSDIPVGNAIFLKRRYKDEEKHTGAYSGPISVLKSQFGYNNTFAANIFDLYRNSFFMEDSGIVGMFAQEKLNQIMAKAKRIIKGDENRIKSKPQKKVTKELGMEDRDWDTLELVGDPLAKQYFSSVKAVIKGIGE